MYSSRLTSVRYTFDNMPPSEINTSLYFLEGSLALFTDSTSAFSFSVSPSNSCIWSNLFWYLDWSSNILQSLLLMMACLTTGEEMMSSTSCVTTMASPKNLRTVLNRYLIYSAKPSFISAFQASSINIILRIPFIFRILLIKTSMMMIVTTGNKMG